MRDKFSMAKKPSEDAAPRNFIFEWRKHRGFNQEALADKVGLTPSSISQLENGKQGFSDSTLVAMAKALDCRPGDLLLWAPEDVDASTGPISQPNDIRKALERIEGLNPADVTVLLSAIAGFRQANAARQEQALPDDQSERATHRHVSTPSR